MSDKKEPDAIELMEKAWEAAQSDRFRRNSHVQTIATGIANSLPAMKEHQKRIDVRAESRAKAAEEAKKKK